MHQINKTDTPSLFHRAAFFNPHPGRGDSFAHKSILKSCDRIEKGGRENGKEGKKEGWKDRFIAHLSAIHTKHSYVFLK